MVACNTQPPTVSFPARKGRGTRGRALPQVRTGEDVLPLGWVGYSLARGCSANGAPADLPEIDPRRDGSGTGLAVPLTAVAALSDT